MAAGGALAIALGLSSTSKKKDGTVASDGETSRAAETEEPFGLEPGKR